MPAYYNEYDPYAAQWLRNLIDAGHIAAGEVDERSIVDVQPDDLRGYTQCHFFAGIAGWSYALRLAGWPDERECWTGSCPCQPLSVAGQRQGHADQRHLWPAFHRLIAECRPATLFGEQVASADGREWLAAVCADLEGSGYAVGAADLPACSVGAPHIRQRLWFVADRLGAGLEVDGIEQARRQCATAERGGAAGELADDTEQGRRAQPRRNDRADRRTTPEPRLRDAGELADAGSLHIPAGLLERGCALVETEPSRPEHRSPWSTCDWLPCRDGKARPVEPGTFPLAHGIPGRVGRLRAYGNAIVPQVAAKFIGVVTG